MVSVIMLSVADSADRPLWPVIIAVMQDGGMIFLTPPHDAIPIAYESGVELLSECLSLMEWAEHPQCALGLFFAEEKLPIEVAASVRDGLGLPIAHRTMILGEAALTRLVLY